MKKSIGLWQFAGFASVSLAGTLLHFLYDWTGQSVLSAPFSGVNESTWEHMKLLFWPMFLFAVVQSFFFRDRKDFWCLKRNGTFLGLVLIPVIFYTTSGTFGPTPAWFNIALFYFSAASVFLWETRQFRRTTNVCSFPKSALLMLVSIAVLFVVFTFAPPEIGLFRDPMTGMYGLKA